MCALCVLYWLRKWKQKIWCLQMGWCLPCSQGETVWAPSSCGIHHVISRIYLKAQSSPVVTSWLTFFRKGGASIGLNRTKSGYDKQCLKWAGTHQYAVSSLLGFTPWRTGTFYGVPRPLTSSQYPCLSSPYQNVSWWFIMTHKLL